MKNVLIMNIDDLGRLFTSSLKKLAGGDTVALDTGSKATPTTQQPFGGRRKGLPYPKELREAVLRARTTERPTPTMEDLAHRFGISIYTVSRWVPRTRRYRTRRPRVTQQQPDQHVQHRNNGFDPQPAA